ncbi:hypothetical protein FDECE_6655 [Fusarium decemcellulare]|nr:hypothetical protein FDECE_6655 [Fusarium decemcellulare]
MSDSDDRQDVCWADLGVRNEETTGKLTKQLREQERKVRDLSDELSLIGFRNDELQLKLTREEEEKASAEEKLKEAEGRIERQKKQPRGRGSDLSTDPTRGAGSSLGGTNYAHQQAMRQFHADLLSDRNIEYQTQHQLYLTRLAILFVGVIQYLEEQPFEGKEIRRLAQLHVARLEQGNTSGEEDVDPPSPMSDMSAFRGYEDEASSSTRSIRHSRGASDPSPCCSPGCLPAVWTKVYQAAVLRAYEGTFFIEHFLQDQTTSVTHGNLLVPADSAA